MPIIDAHLHLFAPSPQTTAMASAVGHAATAEYLQSYYAAHDIAMGIVMSNHTLNRPGRPLFPLRRHRHAAPHRGKSAA